MLPYYFHPYHPVADRKSTPTFIATLNERLTSLTGIFIVGTTSFPLFRSQVRMTQNFIEVNRNPGSL